MLALGTVPVSFYEFAFPGEVGGPWATELLDGQTPVVLKGELNVEQIAALQPDLIIGINQALTQQQYDQLTVIAPTLARPAEYTDYGVPPMVQAQLIGQALGKSAEIEALGADVQTSIDDAKAANPELEGKTVSVVWPTPDGSWFAYSSTDPRVRADGVPRAGAVAGHCRPRHRRVLPHHLRREHGADRRRRHRRAGRQRVSGRPWRPIRSSTR